MLNASQWTGLLMIALAGLACFSARKRSPWLLLTMLHAILLTEMLVETRYRLHDLVNAQLLAVGLYQQRSGSQIILLAGLAVAALIVAMIVIRTRRPAARVGLLSSGGLALLFLVEMVSLHDIDAFLYQTIGPIHLIAWLWVLLCLVTLAASRLDKTGSPIKGKRRRSSRVRQKRR